MVKLEKFEDILEPRRRESSSYSWILRELHTISPYKHNKKYTPELIKVEVLKSPKVSEIIQKVSREEGIPEQIIQLKVKEILDEIGFNRKVWVIRALGLVLTKITLKIYQGIFVNTDSINYLKSRMGNVPIMYVPSHRSYADFILMSYLLFYYDIEIPSIAAGMDFHGMKGMGTILRNTGAFFMRRSYNSDNLYWDTFREYVHQLVMKGEKGIEFFVEGTRSRTSKSLYPKFGLLTMILKAFFNGEVPDVLFVPINISYDRIMEEKLFVYEMLGVPKPRESTSGLLKSLKIVKENLGNVYVNFGKPISSFEFFSDKIDRTAHGLKPVHVQTTTIDERKATALLAQTIVQSQQKLCTITTFNMIALVITQLISETACRKLTDLKISIPLELLCRKMKFIQKIFEVFNAVSDFDYESETVINSINVHNNLLQLDKDCNVQLNLDSASWGSGNEEQSKGYALLESTRTAALPFILLQLYVNPVLHYFINPCLIIAILRKSDSQVQKEKLFEEFNFLRSLFSKEFVLFKENSEREFYDSLKQLQELNLIALDAKHVELQSFSHGNLDLQRVEMEQMCNLFTTLLEPFLITYYIVCSVSKYVKPGITTNIERNILSNTQREIEILLLNADNKWNGVIHPYALSLETMRTCIQSLTELSGIGTIEDELVKADTYRRFVSDMSTRIYDYIAILPKELKPFILNKL